MNEVLNIDGDMWCIMPRNGCLGSPTTSVGFGKTIGEAEKDYRDEVSRSVFGDLPKDLEVTKLNGFYGIECNETNVAFIGYSYGSGYNLQVEYVAGKRVIYRDVPREVWEQFLISPSKGKFLAEKIKGSFSYYLDRESD